MLTNTITEFAKNWMHKNYKYLLLHGMDKKQEKFLSNKMSSNVVMNTKIKLNNLKLQKVSHITGICYLHICQLVRPLSRVTNVLKSKF